MKLLARQIRAVRGAPARPSWGPIIRYVDRQRALIWFELETPGLVQSPTAAADQNALPIGGADG